MKYFNSVARILRTERAAVLERTGKLSRLGLFYMVLRKKR